MSQIGFYFDQTRCTGCYTCSVACKDWYDIDAGPASLMRVETIEKGTFPNLYAAFLAVPCYQCEAPLCAAACPEKAIRKRDSDGIVVLDQDRCTGNSVCPEKCLKACPYGAPQFGPEPGAKMSKCHFCLERLNQGKAPVCVEACPMMAIDVGPLSALEAKYEPKGEAEGHKPSKRCRPAVRFRPRPCRLSK